MKTSDSMIKSCEPKNPANKGENERRETHAIPLPGARLVQMREKIKAAKGLPQLPAGRRKIRRAAGADNGSRPGKPAKRR